MIEEHIAKHQDMSYNNRYCIIMAGGTANHFWPVSRESRPKQFLDIAGTGDSFIRSTYERFSRIVPSKNILVVTLTRFSYLVRAQIPELPEENLLLEPYARNTAPCIAYATYCILKRDPDATVIATPADHIIKDEARFKSAMLKMMDYAENNSALMTLGIHPTEPDTSYGYIQAGSPPATTPRSRSRPSPRNPTRLSPKCSARRESSTGTREYSHGKLP